MDTKTTSALRALVQRALQDAEAAERRRFDSYPRHVEEARNEVLQLVRELEDAAGVPHGTLTE